ncbi:hypothetical protein [Thermogymnomonas acidicola]|uniref:hypothetical protein n=1 Tax=Thermogymnomonas acidicola TaxID=399579 RepID=UPI0014941A5E|nr:hypothetical protein [Thermogymnomonas acidicola]
MAGEFADFLLSLLSSRSEYAEVRFMREEGKSVSFNRGGSTRAWTALYRAAMQYAR